MSWYRAELPSDTSQLELMLGPTPKDHELEDFFKTEEQLHSIPAHLKSSPHHPLIKKPFRFTTPIPPNNAKHLRFKPAGTYTAGIYIAEDYETAIKERLNAILKVNGNLNISIFTFNLNYIQNPPKNAFNVDARSVTEKLSLYHATDYELCNVLFESLAIGADKKPLYNLVDYTSLRNPKRKNNLIYDIFLLDQYAKNITSYMVIKLGNSVEVLDAVGESKFKYTV